MVLEDGEGWNPGNSTPWSCSKSAAGMCNVSWGYFARFYFDHLSCQQSMPPCTQPPHSKLSSFLSKRGAGGQSVEGTLF
jgi:hypothetical protein